MASVKPTHINDWHRLLGEIGSEHKHVLQSTLPTQSFRFLLEAQIRDCRLRLAELDLSREPADFKDRYRSIRQQQDLARDLLQFVNSLSTL